ncbi:MAG: hypothetical protein KGL16_11710 [Acidobacteriota bacterium]|nr:hypothetical protein [Acidobacteriota bacterium]
MAVVALGAGIAVTTLVATGLTAPGRPSDAARRTHHNNAAPATGHARAAGRRARGATAAGTYGVGMITLHLVDHTRTITLPGGQVVPRPLTTVVRFPTVKASRGGRRSGTPQVPATGRFPLVVFGHGFDIMPGLYARLLRYWTSAGFVVAAPIFPLENAHAPGGPNESDLPNQPDDMRFVISSLLRLSARRDGPLGAHVNPRAVAVAGHSDGGDTALALAYDPSLRDPNLKAAVILSGAEIPMLSAFRIAPGGPPLLATQGSADLVNLPSATAAFFDPAPRPKFLLQLVGGSHIGPYTTDRRQLASVEGVTTAFLQYYLAHDRAAMRYMRRAGNVPRVADLRAYP